MEYFKPPTDNLYKFIAISGLLFMGVAFYIHVFYMGETLDRFNANQLRLIDIWSEYRILALQGFPTKQVDSLALKVNVHWIGEWQWSEEQLSQMLKDCEGISQEVLKFSNVPAVNDPDAKEFWMKYRGIRGEDYDQLVKEPGGDHVITHTITSARALLRGVDELPQLVLNQWQEQERARAAIQFRWAALGLGALLTVFGFALWWWRVQRKQDAILDAEFKEANRIGSRPKDTQQNIETGRQST